MIEFLFAMILLCVVVGLAGTWVIDTIGDLRDHWRERMGPPKPDGEATDEG